MKNEKGYAFLIVLLTVVFISLVGVSLVSVSGNTLKTTSNERVSQSSFYIAEAGINIKASIINEKIKDLFVNLQSSPNTFETSYKNGIVQILNAEKGPNVYNNNVFSNMKNGNPLVNVHVSFNAADPYSFTIVSEGKIDDKNSRTLEKTYYIDSQPYDLTSTTQSGSSELTLVTPTQPVGPAKIYVKSYLSLFQVLQDKLNAQFYHIKSRKILTTHASALPSTISENNKLNQKLTFNHNFNYPHIADPSLINKTNIDSDVANVSSTIFTKSSSSVSQSLNQNSNTQTLPANIKLGQIDDNSNLTLNLIVNQNTNLYLFEAKDKYDKSNLILNVTGNGKLNIIVMNTLEVTANKTFNINAPDTKVNLYLKNGFDVKGKLFAQNIYSHGGELDIHTNAQLQAADIYSNKGDLDIEYDTVVNTEDIYIAEKDLKIYWRGELTAKTIYIHDGTLDMNNRSKLSATNIQLRKGNVSISINATLLADLIYVNGGNISSWYNAKVTAKTMTTRDGEINATLGGKYVANLIVSSKDVRIDAVMNVNAIYANNVYGISSSKINANEDLGEGHYQIINTPGSTNTDMDFYDDDNIVQSDPLVELD